MISVSVSVRSHRVNCESKLVRGADQKYSHETLEIKQIE